MKNVKAYDYSDKVAKKFKTFSKKNKGVQNKMFKLSLQNTERFETLARTENLLNGMFYYVFAPNAGLHTNGEVFYKDNDGNWFDDLGLVIDITKGLYSNFDGMIPLTDTIIDSFK